MSRSKKTSLRSGFTLVELLIIAPIALLVITGFIALMVTMVGDVIASRSQNVMTYDIQSALDTIERDVRLSTEFLTTTGAMPSPQGKDQEESPFTNSLGSGDLILGEIATDKNPVDPTRGFIHYDAPFSCTDPTEAYQNRIFFITVVYTVRDGSLWRRTYVPTASGLCQQPWQVNTCAPNYPSTATQCQTNDSEILKNVKNFDVKYYLNARDTTPISEAAASTASTIGVTLEGNQTAAGRTINAALTGRSTKLSSKEVTLAPPAAPVVSGSNSGRDAVFSWPSVPTASSYIVQYSVAGIGTDIDWVTASENTTETVFSIPANHGDTVSVRVRARNTTGASAVASTSAQIPLWLNCTLLNGWTNYGASYPTCGYTITKAGVVVLKGLVNNTTRGSNSMIFRLPIDMAPSHRLIFAAQSAVNNPVRVQVQELDSVYVIESSGAAGWVSLSGITFIPKSSSYSWSDLSFQNSWKNYSTVYGSPDIWSPLRATRDSAGRMHLNGLITPGTEAFGTIIASLPSGSTPSDTAMIPALSVTTGHNAVYVNSTGNLTSRGLPSGAFLSTQGMYYPSTYFGWQNFTIVPGAPADGQIGNGWTTYSSAPKYTKSSDGIVTVHNLIKSGLTANGTVFAKLPPGYRPAERHIINTVTQNGVARIDVLPDGRLILQAGADANWTSLEGITFLAEQ